MSRVASRSTQDPCRKSQVPCRKSQVPCRITHIEKPQLKGQRLPDAPIPDAPIPRYYFTSANLANTGNEAVP